MNKKFLNYMDWQGTADTLHMSSTSRGGTRASLLDGGRGIHGDYTR